MKALVGAFNQKKALVGDFSVIVQLRRLIVYITILAAAEVRRVPLEQLRQPHLVPRLADPQGVVILQECSRGYIQLAQYCDIVLINIIYFHTNTRN